MSPSPISPHQPPLKILLLGGSGRLGSALKRELARSGDVQLHVSNRTEVSLDSDSALIKGLQRLPFDVLINCAAFTSVDDCESNRPTAYRINYDAVGTLATICSRRKARFIHFSTDYVFDGMLKRPYRETDLPNPGSVYGKSKWQGEKAALAANEQTVIIRTSWLFGPDKPSFPEWLLGQQGMNVPPRIINDRIGSPTFTCDLAKFVTSLVLEHGTLSGLLHLANQGSCSWFEYAQHIVQLTDADINPIPISAAQLQSLVAPRPANSALDSSRFESLTGITPRSWQEALAEYLPTKQRLQVLPTQ